MPLSFPGTWACGCLLKGYKIQKKVYFVPGVMTMLALHLLSRVKCVSTTVWDWCPAGTQQC